MSENEFLLAIFAGVGMLFVLIALPLVYRKIGPNSFYGVRTNKTLADKTLWYEANHRFGRDMMFGGICIVIIVVATTVLAKNSISPSVLAILLLFAMFVTILFAVIRCQRSCRIF
ncbi:SdpI family protein [Leptolyngbya sp. 7M]|uniref:SdpI family protein n=1 Tax=Leptolyngbya sp. 7M TaxID=2812896 RepID=UPI001B8DA8EF|nr:SdpI family protein [Leptolyngbya sp. 7M]QYO66088.1 SdpI family protein [Leptolyngbya sp. 7M]